MHFDEENKQGKGMVTRDCELLADSRFVHELSCDSDKKVQAWLLATQNMGVLCQDLEEMSDVAVFNLTKQEFATIPRRCLGPVPCWHAVFWH
jgi:hypothetical protein